MKDREKLKDEQRMIRFDAELGVEAYQLKGLIPKFPAHFHEYYVIGYIETGKRCLRLKEREYAMETGDLMLFNPRDTHTCRPVDQRELDYRAINIPVEVMREKVLEITGEEALPRFSEQVICRSELVEPIRELFLMLLEKEKDFNKEERFFFLIEQLLAEYADGPLTKKQEEQECSAEVKAACEFLEQNFDKNIILDDLSAYTGYSKYRLLRAFTKQMGISPYSYLMTVRIGKAKKMLEAGSMPIETAMETGFTDQSHFTNHFKRYIGLTPKQYRNIFDPAKNRQRG